MDGNGGQEGFNPGRGRFNAGRGGFVNGRGGFGPGRGGGNNRGGYAARGGCGLGAAPSQGAGRGGRGYSAGRGSYGNNGFGGGRHYAHGESSGTAGMGSGHHEDNWGGMNTNFQRGANFNNNARFGHGANQQRWNSGRGGGFQYRPRGTDTGVPSRSGIDADLLQQTVQEVVDAVTAATKAVEPSAVPVSHAAGVDGDRGQQVGMPVAAPTTSQLPTVISQEPQDNQGVGAKGKENEGQGALKKKKEDKAGCFRCKKPGHYIDDCPTPFCDLCESIHHATSACHLLNAPKPTTILHGWGFYKLHFEVETTQGSQEVNMAEANNGNDGNDDANNGEESHGGGNAMDMDPKGVDEGNTSNNNGKEGTYENNGVEGMQVQSNHVDAIQIGTMNVQLTPTDSMARAPTSGLPQVAGVAAAAGLPLADNLQSAQPADSVQWPAIGAQAAQQPAVAHLPGDGTAQRARQAEALPANDRQGTGQPVESHAPVGVQHRSAPAPEAGSAVAAKKLPRLLFSSPSPQRILKADAADSAAVFEDSANHGASFVWSVGSVLGILATIVIFYIVYRYVKKNGLPAINVNTSVAQAPAVPARTAPYAVVPDSQIRDATVERFLKEIAGEKPIRFTPQQLLGFTNNYSARLGAGGFGAVYKGMLPNGLMVAVKRLHAGQDNRTSQEQFMAEDDVLQHPLVNGLPPLVLQYADDTLIILRAEPSTAERLKKILDDFTSATGLVINFTKSTLVPMSVDAATLASATTSLGYAVEDFPQTYLGLLLSRDKLTLDAFIPLIAKADRYLSGWRALLLSPAGRLVLVNAVLDSLPTHAMDPLMLSPVVIKALNSLRRSFLWDAGERASEAKCVVA
ncbi:hypothetical protein ACQ4PT_034237 [Festuca glaucescens]